jgi:hypothetical protein
MRTARSKKAVKHRRQAPVVFEDSHDDEDDTPTVKEAQKLPRKDSLVIQTEDGVTKRRIQPNDWYCVDSLLKKYGSDVQEACSPFIKA